MRKKENEFVTTTYVVRDRRFRENETVVRAVVLADLHNNCYGSNNERLLQTIDEIAPQVVLIAGDLLVGVPGESLDVPVQLVTALAKKYPIYYGIGNHEYRIGLYEAQYGDMYQRYVQALAEAGVEMMHNCRETISLGNVPVDVVGAEIDRYYYKRFRKITMDASYLAQILPPVSDRYTILLAHHPDYFSAYAAYGADLTLAGHVHGGVMQLFGRGVISPNFRLFPKYSGGRYTLGRQELIVSRGLGTHRSMPLRIFNPPELIVLEFCGDI